MRSTSGHKNDDYLACGKNFTETYAGLQVRKKIINTIESVSYNFLEVFIACVLKTIDKNSFNKRDIN